MRRNCWLAISAITACWVDGASASQSVSYTYDALGRVTDVQVLNGPGSGTLQHFAYDPAGNRLQQAVTAPGRSAISLSIQNNVATITSAGITFSINVSNAAAGGTVTFTENGIVLGTAPVSNGASVLELDGFSIGPHSIRATYSGDGAFAPAAGTFSVQVRDLRWLPSLLDFLLND